MRPLPCSQQPFARNTMKNRPLKCLIALILLALCSSIQSLHAQTPSWWLTRGVVDTNQTPDDYHPANQGQVKFIAQQALQEMEPNANAEIRSMVQGFATNENNYLPVNVGQVKNTAKPFYDRLIALGKQSAYPWTTTTSDDADYRMANIGQVKNVFSFDLNFNEAPTLSFITPASGNVNANDSFVISWTAADPDDNATIALYYDTNNSGADGTLITASLFEDTHTQYTWNCAAMAENTYYIYAIIDDGVNDALTVYSPGTVSIVHNLYAPSVSLTGPGNGTTYTTPTTASLTATASDQDGNLQQVDFYVDGELVGTDYSAPFSTIWRDLKTGSYTIQARAMDTGGLTAWSGTRTIHVQTPPLQATFAVESVGWKSYYAGHSVFRRDGEIVHAAYGAAGQGLNVLAYDLDWGARITLGKRFNTYASRKTGVAHADLINYINALPSGSLIMISACDDAGLTYWQGEDAEPPYFPGWDQDEVLHYAWASNVVNLMKSLGSVQIDNYTYQDSWSMVAIKGQGLLHEQISASAQTVTARVTRAVGSIELAYDYRDSMTYHHYWDCSTLYVNAATPSATCHPGTDTVCAYVNDRHRNLLSFNSSKRFVTDGMKFFAWLEESQFEHMNVRMNEVKTYRWQDWANPHPGEQVWQKFPMNGDYEVSSGANSLRIYTDHFQSCGSGDGSVHFDSHEGQVGKFYLFTTDGDDDDDGMPDAWELYYGLDPMDPYDAESDNDNDGITNLGEYNSNTNPG
ncbi:MAG: hypothetical protein EOM20_16565 [Spartobacteria bacterium]|nr:hypothetical protein [Spartobacteria bacterium]